MTESDNLDSLLIFTNSQDEACRSMMPQLDSQELVDILENEPGDYGCEFYNGNVKREVSIPLSPPDTPNPSLMETQYTVPIDLNFQPKAGRYNFQLEFLEEKKEPSKSCPHTYSKDLKKIFCQKNVDVPIVFTTSFQLPETYEIRSYLMFDDPRYQNHTVEKCPVDLKEWQGKVEESHIIINKHRDTWYTQCASGHWVTVSPGSRLSSNDNRFSDVFQFACYTTCRGGINRRNVSALFALYSNDRCHGQVKVPIVICSCPGRDRKNTEKKAKAVEAGPSLRKRKVKSEETKEEEEVDSKNLVVASKRKALKLTWGSSSSSDDDRIYTVQVRGRTNQKILQSLANKMEDGDRYYRVCRGLPPLTPLNKRLPSCPSSSSKSPPFEKAALYDRTNVASSPAQSPVLIKKNLHPPLIKKSFKIGFILGNKGITQLRKALDKPENKNDLYEQRRFRALKKEMDVRCTTLERSQSDPTEIIRSSRNPTFRISKLTVPLDMFKPES